jgi:phosphoenolpyruvate synthase/pyruvate phosphate dikinase
MKIVPVLKSIFAEAGRRLKDQGVIDHLDDIYYLKLIELREAKEWPLTDERKKTIRSIVERRKHKWASLGNKPFIDYLLLLAGQRSRRIEGAVLTGIPASPGIAEEIAKVIRDSSEFHKLPPIRR